MARALLITAGPTHEPIDAVRYLANRSSGRLGIALAECAAARDWKVTLLLGPTPLAPPTAPVSTFRYTTTADLEALLVEHFAASDVLIMAAAVADYRPAAGTGGKLERGAGRLTLELQPTPDLVATCAARKTARQRVLGFALEDAALLEPRAAAKLRRKGLDAIVANPLETPEAADIAPTLMTAAGERQRPPAGRLPKAAFAAWLLDWIERHWPV